MTELERAIAEVKRVSNGCDPWHADDLCAGRAAIDDDIATILNAVASGVLTLRADADLAVALMVEKAAERLEANRAQLNFAAILGLLRDAPLPEAIVTALSGWLDAIAEAIRALVPASALAELQALRDDVTGWISNAQVAREKWSEYEARAEAAEAELVTLRAQVERLTGALTIAANRLHRCSVDYDTGTREFIEVGEWADEARAALTEGAAP